jgi:glutamine cyclotransferase
MQTDTDASAVDTAVANSKNQKWSIVSMISIVSMVCVVFAVLLSKQQQQQQDTDSNSNPTVQSSPTTASASSTLEPTPKPPPPQPHILAPVGPDYQVLKVIPHDESAFTQGLFIHEGNFVEGTGMYGESVVRIYDMQDGTIHKQVSMEDKYFGEGITSFTTTTNTKDAATSTANYSISNSTSTRLVQLTWKAQTGFIYDIDTLEVVQEFKYSTNTTEGWGITFDSANNEFLVSDGSEWIHVWDATSPTLQEKRRYPVTFQSEEWKNSGRPPMAVRHLNELEFDAASGTLLANVWYQNLLLRIDPHSGQVLRVYDMSQLYPATERSPKADSFNGIAVVVAETTTATTTTTNPNGDWKMVAPHVSCETLGVGYKPYSS